MIKKHSILRFHSEPQFNMTPMIDVVFLLIIFFMLICQFIVRENYTLAVPDDCPSAVVTNQLDRNAVTVSVFPGDDGGGDDKLPLYAVRASVFDPYGQKYKNNFPLLLADLTDSIADQSSAKVAPLIHIRADRNLTYGQVQNALLASAGAGQTKIQIAAFRSEKVAE
ncbi:MAG: biopolymer transporter ExbD [Phycisphaerae bacterium]|nr:biopolymer transporter ExbD [Phycisphaerae bacterium]